MIWSSMSVTLETSRTVEPGPPQVAHEDVVYSSPAVAEVRRGVHGGPAQVDRHRAGLAQGELADLPRGGVVQAEHDAERYVRPSAAPRMARVTCVRILDRCPRSPRNRRSTASKRAGPSAGSATACTASTAPPARADVFSIDTPPPTVSGSIHMGTVFGYTQTDALARYRRMAGKAVFYPIGWDDNGLATERRVQNFYGVRCDPSQPYDPDFTPPYRGDAPKDHREVPISRPNFVDAVPRADGHRRGRVRGALPPRSGMSFDWTLQYATINDLSRRTSQVGVPPQPGARRGLQRRGADGLGRRRPHGRRPGRDRGPRASRRLPPHRLRRPGRRRAHRHHPPRADRQLRGDGRPPRRRALRRTRRLDGAHADASASRSRSSPTRWPSRTRAPASPWSARSATPPTSRGGASWTCRRAA